MATEAGGERGDGHSLYLAAFASSAASIVLAISVLLLFLQKAYTIDDVTFLLQAQHALTDPLHPTAFEMVFHGERIRLSRELVTGPVMAYLLIPSVLLDGAEWVTHLIQAVLLACGAFFTSALSLRMGLTRSQAAIAAAVVVVSPAVLAMAATGMPDGPAMVFGLVGIERMVAAHQERRTGSAAVGSLFLVIAALSRPHALLLFPVAALLLLDLGKSDSAGRGILRKVVTPEFLWLAAGIVCWAAFVVLTRDPFSGDSIVDTPVRRATGNKVMFNLASFVLHWAVGFPLAVMWPLVRGRDFFDMRRTRITFLVGLLGSMYGNFLRFGLIQGGIAIVIICHSFDVLVDIVRHSWRNRGHGNLGLAAWLFIGTVTASYVHLPEKVLVPSAPAMAILVASQVPAQIGALAKRRLAAALFGATIVASFVLGVLIITADTSLAENGRQGGKTVAFYRQRGERVWIDGGWGFQWYAMSAGANVMAKTPPFPTTGDVVVTGPTSHLLQKSSMNRTLIYRRIFPGSGGQLFGDGAGFYENTVGPWPWLPNEGSLGSIEAWRIGAGWVAMR